ncbi:MAG TPA: hypothetical protein VGL59_01050 [Polyangia bacterium]|jgi:hypothetical protein
MTRFALLLASTALVTAACSASGTPAAPGGSGGQSGGAGGAMTTGTGGSSSGTGGAGGATTGTGGAPSASGGNNGTTDAGNASDGAPAADSGTDAGGSACPAGAIICEDFEKYAAGTTDLTPDWLTYTYGSGAVHVDTGKAFKGTKALHLTTPIGGRQYADIIKQNPPDKELLPIKHFGRVMVWLSAMPSAAHWNINQAGGPLASNAQLIGKYSFGGQNAVLSPNYTQRAPVGDGLTPLRGGGPEANDPNPPPIDCGPNAQNQKLAVGKWVCWEWMFDGQANKIQLFLDGVDQTQADVTGAPGTCGGWQGPKLFNKMILGWEVYTQASDKAQDAWLDDLVVSADRVGCPAAP